MSGPLLAAILFAAILHATWNFFAKRSGGSLTVLWLGAAVSTLATLPTAAAHQWGKPIRADGLAVACASGVIHCAYWWGLARMYRFGDISLTYPVARGAGVLGTAVGSMLFIREPLSTAGGLGIVVVCAGIFALGYKRRSEPVRARAVAMALFTGLTITGYSLVDDRGVEMLDPAVYLAVETGVGALILALLGWKRLRVSVGTVYKKHWRTVWIIGVGSPVTYLIILFAYARGPVSYITAVREFSVVIAALLGARFLHERMSAHRWAGVALVVAGMVLIKLA